MYIFNKLILFIFFLKYSSSYRLKSGSSLTSTLTKIFKNKFNLNSQLNDNVKNESQLLKTPEFGREGWLLELNEKNVEDVFDLIRGQFADDGGGIELVKIVDHVVYVMLTGSCVGCPYRSTTIKEVVLENLRKFLKSPNDSPIRIEVVENNNKQT